MKNENYPKLALVFFFALVSFFGPIENICAKEVIQRYESNILIETSGEMEVMETITVQSERRAIKRGIYRDFPLIYKDRIGNRIKVGFQIISISRNGQREPYHTKLIQNGIRIYIGKKSKILTSGKHTYEITYRTHRQLSFFEDFDELYWNVTGNYWNFPIEETTAIVHLPPGGKVLHHDAYTGRLGSKGKDFEVRYDLGGDIAFVGTRKFRKREGLTIAVAWPKGIVSEPTLSDKIGYFIADNKGLLIALSTLMGLFIYYFSVWVWVGRDPPAGNIIPRFKPPKNFSPAALRYIRKMGFNNKVFAAAIVNMAVKGFLHIKEYEKSTYNLVYDLVANHREKYRELSEGEKMIADILLPKDQDSITLINTNHSTISQAKERFRKSLKKEFFKIYFKNNRMLLMPGILITIIGIFISLTAPHSGAPFYFIWFLITVLTFIFAWLLKAPTLLGRKVIDFTEGFELFLSVTEKDRWAYFHPPEITPELFEKYLPYALALDVEHAWSENFNRHIQTTGEQYRGYSPHWYQGDSFDLNHFDQFSDSIGSNLSGALASASTSPQSSGSGSFGGGGSSGGGGGGGGGGGW